MAGSLACGAEDQPVEQTAESESAVAAADEGKDDGFTTAGVLPPRVTYRQFVASGRAFFPPVSQTHAVATIYFQDRIDPTKKTLFGLDVTNRRLLFQIVATNAELSAALGLMGSEALRKHEFIARANPTDAFTFGVAGQTKPPKGPIGPGPVGDPAALLAAKVIAVGTAAHDAFARENDAL
jgi:hypothetical protein